MPDEDLLVASPSPAPPDGWNWYVYGFQTADAAPGAVGVGGHEVGTVAAAGLQALVSRVPTNEYGEEALAERLKDLSWLGAQAQAHEEVLAAAVAAGPVLPLRFGTLYRSRDRVTGLLERHAEVLRAELDRFRGHSEWGVKILADPEAVDRWAAEHDRDAAAAPAPEEVSEGHAYFARKRREAALGQARSRIAADVATDCHECLATAAADVRSSRPQQPELSGHRGEMVLNGAYLVEDAALDGFRAEVDRLAEVHGPRGFTVQLSGPWPPHHFVALPSIGEEEEAEDDEVRR